MSELRWSPTQRKEEEEEEEEEFIQNHTRAGARFLTRMRWD